MPRKKHGYHKQDISKSFQEGFISNEPNNVMNKNEKIIMGLMVVGIILFLALSIFLLFGKGKEGTIGNIPGSTLVPTRVVALTPYPTIPPIENMVVMLNTRLFNPDSATIPKGGFIQFLNIDSVPITLVANDENSSMLDLGVIQPGEMKQVTFKIPGTYGYKNKEKPSERGTIIIR